MKFNISGLTIVSLVIVDWAGLTDPDQ